MRRANSRTGDGETAKDKDGPAHIEPRKRLWKDDEAERNGSGFAEVAD